MIEYLTSINLNDIGNWASILGFAITIITLLMLLGIKKKFLFRSSIDDHVATICKISVVVTTLLSSYARNQKDIEEQFALAEVELRAMRKGATGDLLADIKKSRRMIRGYTSRIRFWIKKDEAFARKIKTSLSVVSAELGHYRKNLLIGR